MSEKTVVRMITGPDLEALVPKDSGLKIEHICIGSSNNVASYTADVKTNALGQVSGGGTRSTSYTTYDVGYAVENVSEVRNTLQFTLTQLDQDGYAIKDQYSYVVVDPGEKRRGWANLNVQNEKALKLYRLKEISIAPTSLDGSQGKPAAWTTPNKTIYDIFALSTSPIKNPVADIVYQIIGGIILFFVIVFGLGACIGK